MKAPRAGRTARIVLVVATARRRWRQTWDVHWTDGRTKNGRSIARAAAAGPDRGRDALVAAIAQALAAASADIPRAIGL
jgi:hypothetical protein